MSPLRALGRLADHWLPRSCALCDRRLDPAEAGFCDACARDLPGAHATRCAVCALRQEQPVARCAACLAHPPAWDRTIAMADYAPPIDRLVVALKFRGELAAAAPVGQLLGRALRDCGEAPLHALVPVPLGRMRLAERGYDQAAAIARAAGRAAGVPVRGAWLNRSRETPPQSRLALEGRAHNLADAFRADPAVAGRRIALVDDVMTTGATLGAAATALRNAGAEFVLNLIAARTP